MDVRGYVDERGGVVGVPELSELVGVDPRETRAWAEENGVPMVGNAFVFTSDQAVAFAQDLDDEEDGGDDTEEDEADGDGDDDDELEEEADEAEETDEDVA